MNEHVRTLSVGAEDIEYEVVESSDATKARIDVDINHVKVVVPEGRRSVATEFIEENADWVLDKKQEVDEYRESAPDRSFEEGEKFPYRGDIYELQVDDVTYAKIRGRRILLPENKVSESSIQDVLEEFYRREARGFFEKAVGRYSDEMNVEYEGIAVRNQRTRWGSCSPKKNLSFNWRLVMAPEGVLEYVVVHELAHLKEKNHTDRFWRVVEEHMPEYKQHANWLKENSVELIYTEDDL